MRSLPPQQRAEALDRLRQTLRTLERPDFGEAERLIPFGLPEIDGVLAGGLPYGALHEIAAANEPSLTVATGFALMLAASVIPDGAKALLWVSEDLSRAENGVPYGLGVDEIGLPPERLIAVTASKSRDVLWTMEEALRCAAVGIVIGEIRSDDRGLDAVATRRLSLAAAEHDTLALILRTNPGDEASSAATRWLIGVAPSAPDPHGIGPPRLLTQLLRNRRGILGSWTLEWHRAEQHFALVAAHSLPVATPPADRSSRPAAVA